MVAFVWFHVKRWFWMVLLVFAIASVGRDAQLVYVRGEPYQSTSSAASDVFLAALRTPFQLLSQPYHATLMKMFSHIPVSLFFVVYALLGSYVFGLLKGMADVFWKRRITYRAFQGLFWLLDAIPMFGLIVLIEMLSLYAAMIFKGDPVRMLPNQHFWSGDFLRANILMWAPMMYISRITAISLSFELGEDYLLTARSKGIRVRKLLKSHLLPNIVPKLLNEVSTVFVMIMSSLLALEFLTFKDSGFMFSLLAGMGQGELGQETLFIDQGAFYIQTVFGYLLMIALFTTLFHLLAACIQWRWKAVHRHE